MNCVNYFEKKVNIQEAICLMETKINELVEMYNRVNADHEVIAAKVKELEALVDYLLGAGLAAEVKKKLEEWLANGTLADIIGDTLGDINKRIDNINTQLEAIITYPIRENEIGVVDKKYNYGDIRRFGAKSNIDCTLALKNCIASLGSPWNEERSIMYIPKGVWEYTETILINKSNISIVGDGIEQTILIPKNCNGITTGVKTWQQHHFGVVLKDFTIDSASCLDGMYLQYMGLNCLIENISIRDCSKRGIYITSSFDFPIRNTHIRGTKEFGIHIEQKNEPQFEEISYITFDNVTVVDCSKANKQNAQWLIDGGNNLYLNNCKTNEGYLGIKFTGECWSNRINNFYMDGLGSETDCFVVDGEGVRNLTLSNIYIWNLGTIIRCKKGKSIIASNLDINPSNYETKAFILENTYDGILNIDNKKYNYEKNINRSLSSPLNIIDETDVKIINTVVDITVFNNQSEGIYEFKLPTSYNILTIFATPKGNPELHNTELSKEFTPTIFTDFDGGYGIVKVKLPYGNNFTTRTIKINVMLLVKMNKSYT